MEDHVIVPFIDDILITDESDSLRAYWSDYASLPMMDDGVITWYKRKNGRFLQGVFNRLEIDTGLNFKRVYDKSEAEIINKRTRQWKDPSWSNYRGVANWKADTRQWTLTTLRPIKHARSTMVHELGHALGLSHPEDHLQERDTIMSYFRDKSNRYFYKKDLDTLTGLYYPG